VKIGGLVGDQGSAGAEEGRTTMKKKRNRRLRKSTQSPPSIEQDLPLEARQDQPGSSGAWSQEMFDQDTEELTEVTDDQIVEIVAEGAEFLGVSQAHPLS
jgi:hypothetical protein